MSEARRFKQQLGLELATELAGEFRFYRSCMEFRRPAHGGTDVIILGGSTKWSPGISLSFHFGRSFDAARSIEKELGWPRVPYQIFMYSPNLSSMKGMEYAGPHTWDVDLRRPPPNLARDVRAAIEGMACPFFERFRELRAARDAMASHDSWCFGGTGHFWRLLLLLDAALDDLPHFRTWSAQLDPFNAAQAAETLARFAAQHDRGPARPAG